jgi:dTMP kinase
MMDYLQRPGLLVAIEGIDGAGKTTQVTRLRALFTKRGWDVVTSKEPTEGPWGRRIRQSAQAGRMSPEDELNAFIEDRREHVRDVIRPALDRGALVILDRYYFSTMAYQGVRGADPESILAANEEFAPRPDLLVVMDLEPETALSRIERRGDEANHFERLHLLEASRGIFLRFPHHGPRPAPDGRACWAVRIDSAAMPEVITTQIEATILQIAVEAIASQPGGSAEEKLHATAAVFGSTIVTA